MYTPEEIKRMVDEAVERARGMPLPQTIEEIVLTDTGNQLLLYAVALRIALDRNEGSRVDILAHEIYLHAAAALIAQRLTIVSFNKAATDARVAAAEWFESESEASHD